MLSDAMKELMGNQCEIGQINKLQASNICDVDWIDNGSLVLYIECPLEQINNLQLRQYKVKYRYARKEDATNENDDDEYKCDEQVDGIIWQNTQWTEVCFDNLENEYLSTIPLKIVPYCSNDKISFVSVANNIEIEIQICCQFMLIEPSMSFWTKYCEIYVVNQQSIVLNDNLKIDDNLNEQKEIELDGGGDSELFAVGDSLIFESGVIRAWRYDEEQGKWRGRGKGNLMMYKNAMCKETRMLFKDVKHENKIRLLQRIDASYVHCTSVLNEVEWKGSDYSMDPHEPLHSLWKIRFIDEPQRIGEKLFDSSAFTVRQWPPIHTVSKILSVVRCIHRWQSQSKIKNIC